MTETRGAEIDALAFTRQNEVLPRRLVRQIRHHEVLQQTLFLLCRRRDVHAPRGVGGLLQKDGVAAEFEDVDRDVQALTGEDGVHDRDVLRCEVAGDGDDEDARR